MTTSHAQPSSLKDVAGTIVLIGAGKMGSAMLDGWIGLGLDPSRVAVIEPQPSPETSALAARGLRLNPDPRTVPDPAVIVIAVKPQVAAEVVPAAAPLLGRSTVVVSIMAGQRLASLERALPGGSAIVRTMPNTPAAIGRGITVAVANARVSPRQRYLAHRLLAAIGAVEWVDDEGLLDAVTAVSGSGPAYVFLLAEALARAGAAAGLPADLAERLARATVAGSGELLHRAPLAAATLRQNVTSRGGTTEAALAVLMGEGGLAPLMERAVVAATRRSRELAG
ncbi:MAG TPA: pyrroline-5-carboxylate reductase [Xanthobacteraceae bacterium]|nr:pyrroline-5-carboxylate reductase [Xanthobacteraceae bacterium]